MRESSVFWKNNHIFIHSVFTSKFKILSDGEKHDNGKNLKKADKYNDPRKESERDTKAKQGEDGEEGNLEQFMDEDGDLDIHYRYGKSLKK